MGINIAQDEGYWQWKVSILSMPTPLGREATKNDPQKATSPPGFVGRLQSRGCSPCLYTPPPPFLRMLPRGKNWVSPGCQPGLGPDGGLGPNTRRLLPEWVGGGATTGVGGVVYVCLCVCVFTVHALPSPVESGTRGTPGGFILVGQVCGCV